MLFGGPGGLLQMAAKIGKHQLAEPTVGRILLIALVPDQLVVLTSTGEGQGSQDQVVILC